ncbi:hypothetical protein BGZ72_007123 [Mortierella alpina]|nr:hypothetical protein BGZ72_007123 [Mortierella alpina]
MRTNFIVFRNLGLVTLAILSCVKAAPVQQESTLLEKRASKVNDWSCKPSADKPYPMVLVHATFPTATVNWAYHGTRFLLKGYCVFQLDYGHVPQLPGIGGMSKIELSAAQLAEFVDKVLAATGTTQVDMMGHSQGGLMPLYYMKRLGGASKVHKIGALAPATHGTSLSGIVELGRALNLYDPVTKVLNMFCAACMQMVHDSDFLKDLYKDGDTSPGVQYFYLATKYDEVITPYTRSFLQQTNANVTNAVIQDYCGVDITEHIFLFANALAFNILENFFSPPPTPRTLNCLSFLSK